MSPVAGVLPEHEEIESADDAKYRKLLGRLSDLSVSDHYDAYGDVAWDSPEFAVDPSDPRWELPAEDPLGATSWYQGLPQATRAQFGLERTASMMKIGLEFERVLKRGLLEFIGTLPNGAPEARYAYHEVVEEAQHSMMFQEFVNRTGFDAKGLSRSDAVATRHIVRLGRTFAPLFFIFVLGGEEPIDYVQRKELRESPNLHPLLERVMRIHVTEEARHLSFARSYLKSTIDTMGRWRRLRLGIGAPIILSTMAKMMLKPSPQLVRRYDIPRSVIAEAYTRNPAHKAESLASMRRVRKLCQDLGLLTPGYQRFWRLLGLYERAELAG